jgi:putative DNA primase/helicase
MDEIMQELWAERSGILNWLIAGALDYLNGGLQTPREVVDATAEYREEMDPVGTFVGQCVDSLPAPPAGGAAAFVPARRMYDAFARWAIANALRPWTEKRFSMAMSQKGFAKERHRTGVRYLNVKLHDVPDRPRGDPDESPHPADTDIVPV